MTDTKRPKKSRNASSRSPSGSTTTPKEVPVSKKTEADKPDIAAQLQSFLARARTDKEIETKFGKAGLEALAALALKVPKGFRLKEGRNQYQEKTSYLEQIVFPGNVKVKKRIWTMRQSQNDPDYVAVQFPEDLDFTREKEKNALRIFPIDSVWFSDYLCDEERFDEYLRWLAEKDYAFAFLNGDIIGGHNYVKETAAHVRESLKRRLAPVAHKILWAQSGPLEARMAKIDGVEPLQVICRELGIHHTDRPVRADVYWKNPRKPIEIYALHGRSQARKDGAKANAIIDAVVNQNFPHFTVMGHLKEGMTNTMTVRRIDPIEMTIKEHTAYAIICPGFLKYEGSEAEKKGYPPPAQGTVAMIIYADNRHEASS